MGRGYHVLSKNERNTRPQYMIFVDCETGIKRTSKTTTEYPFKLGVAHFWRRRRDGGNGQHEWLEFTDVGTFWQWVEDDTYKKNVTYLIAHNVLFDLAALQFLDQLGHRGWECVFAFDSNHTSLYKFRKDGRTLYCVNNANLFRGKLGKWGKAVGYEQVPIDFETASERDLFIRCKRDVAIMVKLWGWWLTFLDQHDCGIFKPTIAAQAFQAYRHRFMPHPIRIHNHEDATTLEREAYRGGRCEPFRIGKFTDGPYYHLDVNSMYSHVMRAYEYPSNFTQYGEELFLSTLRMFLRRYGVIAEVWLRTDEPWFPISRNGYNVYPVGYFRTVLTTQELKLALERDWIIDVGRYARYTMRPLFTEFVDYFYALKQQYDEEGNEVLRQLVKMMLNALHGKFGQKALKSRPLGTCEPHQAGIVHCINAQTHGRSTIRFVGGKATEETREGEAFHSFPAISAHVSANARLELYRMVQEAGHGHCYYVDTDSLIVDRVGRNRLALTCGWSGLGGLKLEGEADEIEIRGPKDYSFGDKLVVKGMPPKPNWLDDRSARVTLWPGLATYLRGGGEHRYQTKEIVRTLKRKINHGRVGEDGWLAPFKYPEDKEA